MVVLWVNSLKHCTLHTMKTFKSIIKMFARLVACIALLPFLPVIVIMWAVALTCQATEERVENVQTSLPSCSPRSESRIMLTATALIQPT